VPQQQIEIRATMSRTGVSTRIEHVTMRHRRQSQWPARFVSRVKVFFLALAPVMGSSFVATGGAGAQGAPEGASVSLPARQDPDSALAVLAARAAANPADAAAWHSYGKAAAERSRAAWRKGVIGSSNLVKVVIAAESSLARAARLAPDSVMYALDLAAHLFGMSPNNISRAEQILGDALERARQGDHRASVSVAANQLGIMAWRRYETLEDRRGHTIEPRFGLFLTGPTEFWKWLELYTQPYRPPLGSSDLLTAREHFRTARRADPSREVVQRHELMAYLDDPDSTALATVAEAQLRDAPDAAWGWLALGLAHHRRGRSAHAAEAFDRGLSRLPDAQRRSLLDLRRILPVSEAPRYAALSDSARAHFDSLFWSVGDPSLLLPGNVFRNEFLARVVYADLRWTNEEHSVRGADSDRGDALVRLGPPAVRASFKFLPETLANVVWGWPPLKVHLFFQQAPLYGTAYMNQTYRTEAFEPVVFSNAAHFGTIPGVVRGRDTVLAQAARFRATADSTDVVLFAEVREVARKRARPSVRDTASFGGAILSATGRVLVSSPPVVRAAEGEDGGHDTVTVHLRAGAGGTGVRLDVLRAAERRSARWMADVPSVLPAGFAVSDLVIAEEVELRNTTATAPRWRDFAIRGAATGAFARGRPVSLLWETYGLSGQPEGSEVRLSITVRREDGTGAGAVAARVLGLAASAVGITTRDRNTLTLAYMRRLPAVPAVAEAVSLDLGRTSPGRYRIVLVVEDRATGRTAQAERSLVVTP
jgi:GWxTD domain-containing protein